MSTDTSPISLPCVKLTSLGQKIIGLHSSASVVLCAVFQAFTCLPSTGIEAPDHLRMYTYVYVHCVKICTNRSNKFRCTGQHREPATYSHRSLIRLMNGRNWIKSLNLFGRPIYPNQIEMERTLIVRIILWCHWFIGVTADWNNL